jgi:hypothetical protein
MKVCFLLGCVTSGMGVTDGKICFLVIPAKAGMTASRWHHGCKASYSFLQHVTPRR